MNGNQSAWIPTPSGLRPRDQAAGLPIDLGEEALMNAGMYNLQYMGVGAPSQAPTESPYPIPESDVRSVVSRGEAWLGGQLPVSAGMLLPFLGQPQRPDLPAMTSRVEDRRVQSTSREQLVPQKRRQSLQRPSRASNPVDPVERVDRVDQVANGRGESRSSLPNYYPLSAPPRVGQ